MNIKPKESTSYDIAVLDWATKRVTNLTREMSKAHSWASVAWSPDGKTIYSNRYDISLTDSDVYAVNVASGQVTNLTAHQGNVLNFASSLSPDGKTLLITSNERGGFQNVALFELATGKRTWVTDTQWEASSGDFSTNGKLFSYTLNSMV